MQDAYLQPWGVKKAVLGAVTTEWGLSDRWQLAEWGAAKREGDYCMEMIAVQKCRVKAEESLKHRKTAFMSGVYAKWEFRKWGSEETGSDEKPASNVK